VFSDGEVFRSIAPASREKSIVVRSPGGEAGTIELKRLFGKATLNSEQVRPNFVCSGQVR